VPTKTEAGERTISLAADAVALLRSFRVAAGELRMKLGLGGKLDDAYVFTRDGAEPYRPGRLGQAFSDHCEAAGFAGVTFHAVRHTHITTLLHRWEERGEGSQPPRRPRQPLDNAGSLPDDLRGGRSRPRRHLRGAVQPEVMRHKVSWVQFRVQFAICSTQVIDNAALLIGSLVNRALTPPHLW